MDVILSKESFEQMEEPKNSIIDFFKEAPFPEVELDIKRSKELLRDVQDF